MTARSENNIPWYTKAMSTKEIEKASGIDRRTQTKILSKEERAAIAESLRSRDIDFGFFPYPNGRDTTRLEPFRDRIESVALPAIAKIADELPIKNVHIGVFDNLNKVYSEYGIGGFSHGYEEKKQYSLVEIDLDPESPNREAAMGGNLRRALRHELFHDARLDALQNSDEVYGTLMHQMINEGLACWYETLGTDEEPAFYAKAINPDQMSKLLEKAKNEFDKSDKETWEKWFNGSTEEGIPQYALYSVGCHLVNEYLKTHPDQDLSPATLCAIRSEEIIKSIFN